MDIRIKFTVINVLISLNLTGLSEPHHCKFHWLEIMNEYFDMPDL